MAERNVEIVRQVYVCVNERRWDALAALLDPDVAQYGTVGGLEEGTVVRGSSAIVQLYESETDAWDLQRIEPEKLIDAGDRVVVFQREYQRGRSSGLELVDEASRLRALRLEDLDGVARRILDEDLTATGPLHDPTTEARPVGSQTLDGRLEIRNDDLEAIPASGLRDATGLAGAASTRLVEKQSQVILRQACESRGSGKVDAEAETSAIEVDRLVDVCHEVPHSRLRHWCSPFRSGRH